MIKKQGILARLEWCMAGHAQNSIEWDGQCQKKLSEVVGGALNYQPPLVEHNMSSGQVKEVCYLELRVMKKDVLCVRP